MQGWDLNPRLPAYESGKLPTALPCIVLIFKTMSDVVFVVSFFITFRLRHTPILSVGRDQINCLECQSHYYMLSVNYSFHLNLPYGIHSMSTVRFKVLHFIHTFPCEICMPSYYRGTRFFEITCLIHFCLF